ncbi:hypothetical protein ACNTMW_15070 [Planosporangium sp. 12N6]|uniref:hypothetical protein n=1 Tax=Planosporangium spinosum TaxID=3402278 RepID=UPI003CF25BD7
MGWFARWRRARRARRLGKRLDRACVETGGRRLCDGDTVLFPGYPRWTDLINRDLRPARGRPGDPPLDRVLPPVAEPPATTGHHQREQARYDRRPASP